MKGLSWIALAVGLLLLTSSASATGGDEGFAHSRIPAFARKYGVSCALCHNPIPRLTEFGETFAGNGFRMASGEMDPDTAATGDETLSLLERLPLAVRLDQYVQAYQNDDFATDIETPYNMKVLSGGTISDDVSYYFYFFLFERGEVGGVEDAFVYVNDLFDAPVDVAVGQFQVSDPLFKRELRLEFQDYAIYRARIGAQPTDLTYDRGVMAIADVGGFTITGEVVNGNGRGEAEPNRRLDDNARKNVFGHLSREIVPGIRLGAMGYLGAQDGSVNGGQVLTNDVWMLGGDATLSYDDFELNAQYLHREDDHPLFGINDPTVETDGGFAELLYAPSDKQWYGFALYNRIDSSEPLLNVRLGGPTAVDRYETLSGGAGYLWRRNLRVFGEVTWDMEQEEGRLTLGLVTAF